MRKGYAYMITNYRRTSLYIGVTNDIEPRMLEHKVGIGSKHAARYKLKYLLHFDVCPDMTSAISREKQLKNWHRDWKWNLVKESNPHLEDLAADWFDDEDIEAVAAD